MTGTTEEKKGVRVNVERPEEFAQVCVWEGTLVGGSEQQAAFVAYMLKELGSRVLYLEEIETAPGQGGPGGRNDLFFAVHKDDVAKFAVPRLNMGIRWLEDVLAPGQSNLYLYPVRVGDYMLQDPDLVKGPKGGEE